VAGFGGVVRCEIGVLPVDLAAEASLDVDFEGEADFWEIITNDEYFTLRITIYTVKWVCATELRTKEY